MSYERIFRLDGKTALVAGASRGIGLAIARALAGAGARTIMAARSADRLNEEAAALRGAGCDAHAAQVDFSDPAAAAAFADRWPDAEILVNVAGTNIRKDFVSYTDEEYHRLLDINLHGLVKLTQIAGKRMIERRRGGKVIFIGSLTTTGGLPYLSVYTITKSAIGGLTKALAAEWGGHNIQVNCICPGFILTDLNRDMWQQPAMADWLRGTQANPELGKPEDIAPLAVFLAGRGSDYITGQLLFVDGGNNTTKVWPFHP